MMLLAIYIGSFFLVKAQIQYLQQRARNNIDCYSENASKIKMK